MTSVPSHSEIEWRRRQLTNNLDGRLVKRRRRPWMGREAQSPEAATQRGVSNILALRWESSRYGTWRLKLHGLAQEFQRPRGEASY